MENMTNKEYQQYAEKKIPKPTYFKNMLMAFLVGGLYVPLANLLEIGFLIVD